MSHVQCLIPCAPFALFAQGDGTSLHVTVDPANGTLAPGENATLALCLGELHFERHSICIVTELCKFVNAQTFVICKFVFV